MKNNTHKILLGLSMLGATTLIGFSTPASAKPNKDVKEARKELKKARKEVRRADSPEERRDAREDYRQERRDYREEVRENRGRRPYGRPNSGPGSFGYRPGSGYTRPNYGGSTYNNSRSLEGVVTRDLSGNDFLLRLYNGQTVRVYAVNGESGSISGGDTVRVTGSYSGSGFRANRITILNNR